MMADLAEKAAVQLQSTIVVQQVSTRPHLEMLPPQVLQRCLNARQFALKLIANVSYGYTSASFSGRMPCAELADAIVQVSCGTANLPSSNWLQPWYA
jgi:DNA polymerase zeta